MLTTVLAPLVDRVKVLLAARAVQELEADYLAGTAGRPQVLDRLAAGLQAGGLDGAAAEVARRSRALAGAADGVGGTALPPGPPALPGSAPGKRGRR
jgi:hypothetical protein